jgi:hypothetical protein
MDSKSQVKAFYEQVGWNKEKRGVFMDAATANWSARKPWR